MQKSSFQLFSYKSLFVVGLLLLALGQALLAKGNEFVYALRPIDFAHWALLVGVVFLLPQSYIFEKNWYSIIGVPVLVTAVVCTIGMCVLDFIFWSYETDELRGEFAAHVSQIPVIWKPFISIGPGLINLGLLILSFHFWKTNKLVFALIFICNLALLLGFRLPLRLSFILCYAITAIGFFVGFRESDHRSS